MMPDDELEALAESHLDLRNAPPGSPSYREPELSASEWRAAYFVLARIALEQLNECRAALVGLQEAAQDVLSEYDQGAYDAMRQAMNDLRVALR